METELISIVFVHWGMTPERVQLSKQSFESLVETTKHLPVEILVINNGGKPDLSSFFLKNPALITVYIRNQSNVSFGEARNQGLREAWGDFLAIVDNDLIYEPGWLESCLLALKAHPNEKIIASPLEYTDKRASYDAGRLGPYRLNLRAGSNCFLMRRETWKEVGPFQRHRIAGSLFTDALVRAGYKTAIAGAGLVKDAGLRQGYNHKEAVIVKRQLLNGDEISRF